MMAVVTLARAFHIKAIRRGEWMPWGEREAVLCCPKCGKLIALVHHAISTLGGVGRPVFCPYPACGWNAEISLSHWNDPGVNLWLSRTQWATVLTELRRIVKKEKAVAGLIVRIAGVLLANPADPLCVDMQPKGMEFLGRSLRDATIAACVQSQAAVIKRLENPKGNWP